MRQKISKLFFLLLTIVLGTFGSVGMAAAADLPDAGKTNSGNPPSPDGIATETQGRADGDPEFYQKAIDERITKIRPMATPLEQISRYAKKIDVGSFEVKYYSVGTRPIMTTVKTQVERQSAGASTPIDVDDPSIFTIDDTIRVVGVKGVTDENGQPYAEDAHRPDLVLCVCGIDSSTSKPSVYAVNGEKDSSGRPIWLPQITVGTKLIRMGKACGELDVQTGRFNNIPMPEIQYCQNFMIQVEQSTFDKIADKEVNWTFTDLEEDSIFDMRLAQENTYLFGAKGKSNHATKDGMTTWFTGGIWYQAGKDIEVGTYNESTKKAEISDDDLVDIAKDLFAGTGVGNKRKVMLCGSDMLAALSKIKSEKFRLKENVEVWNLKFKSWDTDFGEILTVHDEQFDVCGMSDCAFALDPEYLTKAVHVSWSRNVLDLKKAGVRNTDAVVMQEVACLYLRYAKAHARMKLAAAGA